MRGRYHIDSVLKFLHKIDQYNRIRESSIRWFPGIGNSLYKLASRPTITQLMEFRKSKEVLPPQRAGRHRLGRALCGEKCHPQVSPTEDLRSQVRHHTTLWRALCFESVVTVGRSGTLIGWFGMGAVVGWAAGPLSRTAGVLYEDCVSGCASQTWCCPGAEWKLASASRWTRHMPCGWPASLMSVPTRTEHRAAQCKEAEVKYSVNLCGVCGEKHGWQLPGLWARTLFAARWSSWKYSVLSNVHLELFEDFWCGTGLRNSPGTPDANPVGVAPRSFKSWCNSSNRVG